MTEQYSPLEQSLINQELTSLDKVFEVTLDDVTDYWNSIFSGSNINEREDFGTSIYEEDSVNRFSVDIDVIYVKTEDKDFLMDLENLGKDKPIIKPRYGRTDYSNGYWKLFGSGQNLDLFIMNYQKILVNHLERLLKNSLIDEITFQIEICGPILYRIEERSNNSDDYDFYNNDDEDEYFDESMTNLLSHPFCKLPRMRVTNENNPLLTKVITYDLNSSPQEILDEIIYLMKSIIIIPGDKILFSIDEDLLDLFKRWVSDRQSSDTVTEQINQLYPSLTSLQFLSQLHDWTELGKKIVKETELLNSQIQSLTQNPSFDLQTVELLIKTAWSQDAMDVLTRDELLDRWVSFLHERGDTRSSEYLKKNILRPRLNLVIDKVRQAGELDPFSFKITKDFTEKSGKPTTLFKFNKNE